MLIFPLTLFRVTALVIFADYDTKCIILEHASVIDCHQDGIVSNPVPMILAWLVTSNLSTLFFFLIVCGEHKLLPFQFDKAKQWKNYRSFLRILPSLILTEIYYIIRLSIVPSHAGRAISFFLLVWQAAMTLVAYRFRYIRPVKWNEPAGCLNKFLYLFYWINLLTYYLESLFVWFAFTLDLAHEVAPVIEKELPDASSIKVVIVYLLSARVLFGTRLVSCFGHKICYGDRDLERGSASVETQTADRSTHVEQEDAAGSTDTLGQAASTSTDIEEQDAAGSTDTLGQAARTSTDIEEQDAAGSTDALGQAASTSTDIEEQDAAGLTDTLGKATGTSTDIKGQDATGSTSTYIKERDAAEVTVTSAQAAAGLINKEGQAAGILTDPEKRDAAGLTDHAEGQADGLTNTEERDSSTLTVTMEGAAPTSASRSEARSPAPPPPPKKPRYNRPRPEVSNQ